MKQKRRNRKKEEPNPSDRQILAPQYKNLMFEKKVRRGFLASIKTKQKLGEHPTILIPAKSKKKSFRIKRVRPRARTKNQSELNQNPKPSWLS